MISAFPKIFAIRGFPEYYKKKLLEKSFE